MRPAFSPVLRSRRAIARLSPAVERGSETDPESGRFWPTAGLDDLPLGRGGRRGARSCSLIQVVSGLARTAWWPPVWRRWCAALMSWAGRGVRPLALWAAGIIA